MEWIMVRIFAAISIALCACTYDASYGDCAVKCTNDTGCPDGLTCGTEGLCRMPGESQTCTTSAIGAPSCNDLPATCGPTGDESCCATALVPGGNFLRSYDAAPDGMYTNASHPATVSSFVLDKYEVTVGRFRKFVAAGMGTRASPPLTGAGARMLNGTANQSGWDPTWEAILAADTTALIAAVKCATYSWTDVAGANEALPMNCITWFEAFAFCAWDGGFLPTEAEWNYTAVGGSEHRAYPWSSPASSLPIDCTHANYTPSAACVTPPGAGAVNRVGSESPTGDGKWGQADLGGNVWEWTLDSYDEAYPRPCDDCANLTVASPRVIRGGGFIDPASNLRGAFRYYFGQGTRSHFLGVRCARSAP